MPPKDEESGDSSNASDRARAGVRVGNSFTADRTSKCGFGTKHCAHDGVIRKGELCVIVSNTQTEVRTVVHLDCAQKDPRTRPLIRDLTVDAVFDG